MSLVGLSATEDPYELWRCDKFGGDNICKWPPVDYADIVFYFVERPGIFTRQEMKQWKSTEAYNYFQCGHVRQVRVYDVAATQSCIVMAHVNPSQNAPDKTNLSWIGVKRDGSVITAHCTCMAG